MKTQIENPFPSSTPTLSALEDFHNLLGRIDQQLSECRPRLRAVLSTTEDAWEMHGSDEETAAFYAAKTAIEELDRVDALVAKEIQAVVDWKKRAREQAPAVVPKQAENSKAASAETVAPSAAASKERASALFDALEEPTAYCMSYQAARRGGIFLPVAGILCDTPIPESVALKTLAETLYSFEKDLQLLAVQKHPYLRRQVGDALSLAEVVLYLAGEVYAIETYQSAEPTPAQLFAAWAAAGTDIKEFRQIISERNRRVSLVREQNEKQNAAKQP